MNSNNDHAQVGALLAKCEWIESGGFDNRWWAWVQLCGSVVQSFGEGPTQLAAIKAAVEAAEQGVRE